MAKYVLAYRGGGMPETEEESKQVMEAWGKWYETLGSAVADPGDPFGRSLAIAPDGTVSEGAPSGLSGYTVITADSAELAAKAAAGCPILESGGHVDVYETIAM